MPQELTIILGILAVLLLLALVKELFRMIAHGIITGIGKIIKGFFSFVWLIVSSIVRLICAPFALLWGYITSR